MRKYRDEYVCLYVSVYLPVREDITRATRAIFAKNFVHVAYDRGSVLVPSGRVTESEGEGAILGVARAIQKHRQSLQPSLSCSLRKGSFNRQQGHATEGNIQYVRQAQI